MLIDQTSYDGYGSIAYRPDKLLYFTVEEEDAAWFPWVVEEAFVVEVLRESVVQEAVAYSLMEVVVR